MSISVGATLPGTGRSIGAQLATPQERETDRALAAQDQATETISKGLAPRRSELDHLMSQPSVLDRFSR